MLKRTLFLLLLGSIALMSCKKSPSGPNSSDFDRKAMLVNWADNIIIPGYSSFATHTESLKTAGLTFTDNPTQQNLDALRQEWYEAYRAWQTVSMFEIGKAEDLRYRDNLNIYPVNVGELEENISQGGYNLELSSENDRQGFPALDYMIYGMGSTDSEILDYYTSHNQAEAYKTYLNDLVTRIDTLTDTVLDDWKSGYRDEFVNNDGGGATASVDKLVNDYLFYYEKALRSGKIGIPAGAFSGSPLPGHTEAYYRRDISKELFMESLEATREFFNGVHYDSSATGESLRSYLDFLNTIKNGEDLGTLIDNQFDSIRTQASTLDPNFVHQIQTDNSAMLETFDELQKNVVLLKVDMLQALDIDVDYVDTDGD